MSQQKHYSPLRYPGGKASLFNFFVRTLECNDINYGVYAEPFAGGAGAALKLLMFEYVGDIYLNDKDPLIYKFWKVALTKTEDLVRKIYDTKLNLREWDYHHLILNDKDIQKNLSDVDIAFTAFFLNRCNRSGILKGGPIGGNEQISEWKIDARFNKIELIKRIERIALYKERIHVSNYDAVTFLKRLSMQKFKRNEVFVYLDPPYVVQGKDLYKYYFKEADHKKLAVYLQRKFKYKWMVSYDDTPLIHQIYKQAIRNVFEFNYYANKTKIGKELVIGSKHLLLPEIYEHYSRTKQIEKIEYKAKAV